MLEGDRIQIRRACRADLPSVLALYRDAGLDSDESPSLAEAERLFDRMESYPAYGVYVAELDGKIVGTFALLIMDNLAHRGAPSGIVEDVAVAVRHQGAGIGRALMRFAAARCEEAGCYKLVLSSNQKRDAAHRFYESLGFERHGYSFLIGIARRP